MNLEERAPTQILLSNLKLYLEPGSNGHHVFSLFSLHIWYPSAFPRYFAVVEQ